MQAITEEIYKIITNRRHRHGPLPSNTVKEMILSKLDTHVEAAEPVKVFQFWGGAKNPNLHITEADVCEKATLDHLFQIDQHVRAIYKPGLQVTIFPGDERIHKANCVPLELTKTYVRSLQNMADCYHGLFTILPVSNLYKKYQKEFVAELSGAFQAYGPVIETHPNFESLAANARKNIYRNDLENEEETEYRSREAAKAYIMYRLAEEKARIFREYEDCIRFAFIKLSIFTSFYEVYLHPFSRYKKNLMCALHFYTGKKGNITQPWQAVGEKQENGDILFRSQGRL